MNSICKILVCAVCWFFLLQSSSFSQTSYVHLDKSGLFSGNMQGVDFRQIVDELESQYKLVIKGKDILLGTKVSSVFSSLTLENSLKRIFSNVNYCLSYDTYGEPIKVIIFDKSYAGKGGNVRKEVVYLPPEEDTISLSDFVGDTYEENEVNRFQPANNVPQATGRPDRQGQGDKKIENFQPVKNSGPLTSISGEAGVDKRKSGEFRALLQSSSVE